MDYYRYDNSNNNNLSILSISIAYQLIIYWKSLKGNVINNKWYEWNMYWHGSVYVIYIINVIQSDGARCINYNQHMRA